MAAVPSRFAYFDPNDSRPNDDEDDGRAVCRLLCPTIRQTRAQRVRYSHEARRVHLNPEPGREESAGINQSDVSPAEVDAKYSTTICRRFSL